MRLVIAVLLMLAIQAAATTTSLNLSKDLVLLGIASSNMVPNQPSLDAVPLLQSGVAYAVAHEIGLVVADPGTYYFLSVQGNTHVQLGGTPSVPQVSNVTVDFQGSALIFTHPLQNGIILWDGRNVVLQNFTADFQPLPFTQVRVVSVDTSTAQVQYSVEPGWQNPGAFNSAQISPGAGSLVVEAHIFRNGRPAFGTRRMGVQTPLTGSSFTIFNTYGFDPTPEAMAKIRPGDIAVLAMRQFGEPLVTVRCRGCTLRNITAYSSASAAVDTMHSDSTTWERIYSIPKPGTDRLISTFGMGFQAAGSNNQIRLSRAIRTLDGGITPYVWATGEVVSQLSARTLTVAGNGAALSQGITIANGSPVVFQRRSDGVILGLATVVSQTGSVDAFNPPQLNYTFDRDLSANLIGAVMYTSDENQRGGNSVIERNTVQEKSVCCIAMDVWGWAGSTIRGNYISRSAFAPFWGMQSLTTTSWTTPPLVDMTFRNNVLDGANMTPDWWVNELGAIEMVALPQDASNLMTTSPHQNITIIDNFIADPGRAAVWVGNTTGGTVSGNYFLNPDDRPQLASPYPPKTDLLAPLIVDTTSSGIVATANTVDQNSGHFFVTDTQYRELAAYAPGGVARLNAYNIGTLVNPTVTLTDADGITMAVAIQNITAQALDLQLPAGAGLGGAYLTLVAGSVKYFGTLFLDSQDNVPAVNGCIYEVSPSSISAPGVTGSLSFLVVTQAGCPYQALATDAFVTPGASTTGTAVMSVGFAANSGAGRTATIEIAGQPFTVNQPSACDLNTDGNTNLTDVQLMIDEALGLAGAVSDLNRDNAINLVDVQIAIRAALGGSCSAR